MFHNPHGLPRNFERRFPLVSAERLQLLQRIFLDARSQPLLENKVQVHQRFRSQQTIYILFVRRIQGGKIAQRRLFVRSKVIDVHLRIRFAPPYDLFHQPLKCLPLFSAVQRPSLFVLKLPVRVLKRNSCQIFQPVLAHDGLTLYPPYLDSDAKPVWLGGNSDQ